MDVRHHGDVVHSESWPRYHSTLPYTCQLCLWPVVLHNPANSSFHHSTLINSGVRLSNILRARQQVRLSYRVVRTSVNWHQRSCACRSIQPEAIRNSIGSSARDQFVTLPAKRRILICDKWEKTRLQFHHFFLPKCTITREIFDNWVYRGATTSLNGATQSNTPIKVLLTDLYQFQFKVQYSP